MISVRLEAQGFSSSDWAILPPRDAVLGFSVGSHPLSEESGGIRARLWMPIWIVFRVMSVCYRWRVLAVCGMIFCSIGIGSLQAVAEWATGRVYNDVNRNQTLDALETGIPGVRVSNGREIVATDQSGRWRLEVSEHDIIFVIKPRDWMTPVTEDQLPLFYYIHKPAGSPSSRFQGVAPTGDLPESIDFPLYQQEEPERFQVVFFGDPQPRDQTEVDYIAHDVVEELIGTEARFGVTLGDILFDDLSLFDNYNAVVGLIGIPWYNVIGNHDLNADSMTDGFSDETFHRYFGPNYYSFDYGPVHFIVLDNVDWRGREHSYRGQFDARQLQFVANDLKSVSPDTLIVLSMHIPLTTTQNRQELYRLIEDRPYSVSLSGHTHWQAHQFIDSKDGWQGEKPHHHIVNVTVSGTWWRGFPDETGVPHATMRDGAPNGYSVLTFDGHDFAFDFKASRRPQSYQMNIYVPEVVRSTREAPVPVYANVFAGSERSEVRFRIVGQSDWQTMERVEMVDPEYERTRNRELAIAPDAPALNEPGPSYHLWRGDLPDVGEQGVYRLEVLTRDMFGREYRANRTFRVED